MEWPNHLAYARFYRGVSYYTPRGLQRGSDKAENTLGPGYQLLFPIDSKLAKVSLG